MFDSGVDISLPVKVNRRLHLGVDKTFVSGGRQVFSSGDRRQMFVPGGRRVRTRRYRGFGLWISTCISIIRMKSHCYG